MHTVTKIIYKTAYQRPNGVISINVRPFNNEAEAQAECNHNNEMNANLGFHYVIGLRQPRITVEG